LFWIFRVPPLHYSEPRSVFGQSCLLLRQPTVEKALARL
jgi:hypothetical protein